MKRFVRPLEIFIALVLVVLLTWTAFSELQNSRGHNPVWEYHDGANLQVKDLNDLGAQGWELAALIPYGSDYYYVFKRQK
jgi:hypothetical protein